MPNENNFYLSGEETKQIRKDIRAMLKRRGTRPLPPSSYRGMNDTTSKYSGRTFHDGKHNIAMRRGADGGYYEKEVD